MWDRHLACPPRSRDGQPLRLQFWFYADLHDGSFGLATEGTMKDIAKNPVERSPCLVNGENSRFFRQDYRIEQDHAQWNLVDPVILSNKIRRKQDGI